MTRLRGRNLEGQRLHAAIPWGHWKTTTFVAGLRTTGLTAPMVLDGAMNGAAFKAYLEQRLGPSLTPGDIVIMDCPSSKQMGLLSVFHKGGSGSSLFDVKPLGVDGSSGGFGWSVF